MKLFAIILLAAAVAAEDASRSARSLIGLGHGLGGVAIASHSVLAPAPIVLAGAPLVHPVGLHGAAWGHGLHGLHSLHRRSLGLVGHGIAGPAVWGHGGSALWGHGIAAPALVGHGIAAPALVGHGIAAPGILGHGIAAPAILGHGHGALLRHARSIVGAPALLAGHGIAHGAPLGHLAAVPVIASHQTIVPAWGHGIGHGLGHGIGIGHGLGHLGVIAG